MDDSVGYLQSHEEKNQRSCECNDGNNDAQSYHHGNNDWNIKQQPSSLLSSLEICGIIFFGSVFEKKTPEFC